MQEERQWAKVVYKEDNSGINLKIRQGWFSKEDDIFYKVVGDDKTTLINKNSVVAIEFKKDKEEK